MSADPLYTYGPPELCTWSVGAGSCRFQTNDPRIAKKLSQRSGASVVAWSVQGGYLRIFQEKISPRSARNLVNRYLKANRGVKRNVTAELRATNARFLSLKGRCKRRNLPGGLREGQNAKRSLEASK